MFSMKKISAVLVTFVLPLATATDCEGKKADKGAIVKCDTTGMKKATFKEKQAKGTFFTCGGPECVVTVRFHDTGKGATKSSDIHTVGKYKYPRKFTVPKKAKNWSASRCGKTYKPVS